MKKRKNTLLALVFDNMVPKRALGVLASCAAHLELLLPPASRAFTSGDAGPRSFPGENQRTSTSGGEGVRPLALDRPEVPWGEDALCSHRESLPTHPVFCTGPRVDFGFRQVLEAEKERLVAGVFSSVAPKYDVMNDLMSGGLHRLWKDRFVEKLRPFPGMSHLDVAGGTGDISFRILTELRRRESATIARGGSVQPGRLVISDINPDMLEEGKKRAEPLGLDRPPAGAGTAVEWAVANAEELPFESDSFDSVSRSRAPRSIPQSHDTISLTTALAPAVHGGVRNPQCHPHRPGPLRGPQGPSQGWSVPLPRVLPGAAAAATPDLRPLFVPHHPPGEKPGTIAWQSVTTECGSQHSY